MISFVTVSYNTTSAIKELYGSLVLSRLDMQWELVVVDNACDANLELFCREHRIVHQCPGLNVGFSRACNIGASISKGDILYFINPDSIILAASTGAFDDVEDGVVYLPQIDEGVTNVFQAKLMRAPTYRALYRKNLVWSRGAGVILTKNTFKSIGGWSEDYFLYAEDLDFFYRFYVARTPIRVVSCFQVHYGGKSSETVFCSLGRQKMIARSLLIFYKKWGMYSDMYVFYPGLLFVKMLRRPLSAWQPFVAYVYELGSGLMRGAKNQFGA